jgi:sigma-E factor negative regulatory protein RseB
MNRANSRLTIAALLLVCAATEVWADDVRALLDRMHLAVEQLNYEGTFVHVQGGNAENLHVVHRNLDGRISERIVSLDGVGREIIRQDDEVQSILPDRGIVLLKQRQSGSGSMLTAVPPFAEDFEPFYELTMYRNARVAKRETQVIGIKPRDRYRYGYLLWLDSETGMPLKSQMRDENDRVLEQILFTQIRILDSVPDAALRPSVDTEGYTWFRPAERGTVQAADESWRATRLPAGFRLSIARSSLIAGSEYPVQHLVYSDGLATVSVFVDDPNSTNNVDEGFVTVGSTNAFSLTVNGRKVTAVGEVPRQTVRSIATSLTWR